MVPTDQKFCKSCRKTKKLVEFPLKSPDPRTGKRYRRHQCRKCHNRSRISYTTQEARKRADRRKAKQISEDRALNRRTYYFIWQDTRRTDRKHGRENDLTKEFIAEQIAKGCTYCGETEIRMTLDRIDNDRGHTMDNVVPACIRCNYVRGNMPHEAWAVVASGMRRARSLGLFVDWIGRARKAGAKKAGQ